MSTEPAEPAAGAAAAAAAANRAYLAKHGHEDPDYLRRLLDAAHRQAAALDAVVSEVYGRYQAATAAEWATVTDAEILASEHLRGRLISFADRERWASDRLRAIGPKCPLGRLALHDLGEGGKVKWMPTFDLYTLDRTPTAEQEEATAEAIRELGRLWAFGRRLIKIEFMCPDLSEIGWACFIEYEPATEQGRVMTRGSRLDAPEQLVYGPIRELLSAAVDHVESLKGRWDK